MKIISSFFFIFSLIILFSQKNTFAFEIKEFTPEGNSSQGITQVRVLFSEQMIPFGNTKVNENPFEITCESGDGHWVDTQTWIYDFKKPLLSGVECEFKLNEHLKSLSQNQLNGKKVFTFNTGSPSILEVMNRSEDIEEDEVFILKVSGQVYKKSVIENAYFTVEGLQERISVRVLDRKTAQNILMDLKKMRPWVYDKTEETDFLFIQPKRNFPPESKITLVWDRGIAGLKKNSSTNVPSFVKTLFPDLLAKGGIKSTQPQTFPFKVRKSFKAQVNCERKNANSPCIPFSDIEVNFTGEILWKDAKQISLKISDQIIYALPPRYTRENFNVSDPKSDQMNVSTVVFEGPFKENQTFLINIPKNIKDISNRALVNSQSFPVEMKIGETPPLAKFSAPFGIIENSPNAALPVTIRKIEPQFQIHFGKVKPHGQLAKVSSQDIVGILEWLKEMNRQQYSHDNRDQSVFKKLSQEQVSFEEKFSFPEIKSTQEMQVIGLPLKKPGFYIAEIESTLLGKELLEKSTPMFVSTAALVTQMGVHFKKSREHGSSLVWVTHLNDAKPIKDARVSIWNCKGQKVASGLTNSQGIWKTNDPLPEVDNCLSRYSTEKNVAYIDSGFLVTAEKSDDFSFVHTNWNDGIEPWRYGIDYYSYWDHSKKSSLYHTVLDRSLLRAGETVHMKHFLRKLTDLGFEQVSSDHLPDQMIIMHNGSEEKTILPLDFKNSLNSRSETNSLWEIPSSARLGVYSIYLKNQSNQNKYDLGILSGEFRVEEFRVPLMSTKIQFPKEKLILPSEVPVQISTQYLSGGAASKLPIKVRYQQIPLNHKSYSDFPNLDFANGEVKEKSDDFQSSLEHQDLILDEQGGIQVQIKKIEKLKTLSRLQIEAEFKDPNGEIQTVSQSQTIYPSNVLLGIQAENWYSQKKIIPLKIVSVDTFGKPKSNQKVTIELFYKKNFHHRKRIVGGLYGYEYFSSLEKSGTVCSGSTNTQGVFECEVTPKNEGQLIFQAQTQDENNRESFANVSTWFYRNSRNSFAQKDDDRIDLKLEKIKYEPGEKATIQVRMPFQDATALVTVEREGILDEFVTTINNKSPFIEIPIKTEYSPNIYISAFLVRGRVGDIVPTGLVDLGKPAFKMGIAEIKVGWKKNELSVQVIPEKETYSIRDRARIRVQVKNEMNQPFTKGSWITVAAVDEGLEQLKPNETWNLLQAMMKKRSYFITTSTNQLHIVGKRHYGIKAQPHGGGGGMGSTRELFDTLLYWKTDILLNEKGIAEIEIPLNDSLTSFKIAAIAYAGNSQFGTGFGTIRTTQDLMILSGIPPVVRESDQVDSEFTLRNTTTLPIDATVEYDVENLNQKLVSQNVQIPPNQAKIIHWSVIVPHDVKELKHHLKVIDSKAKAKIYDQLKVIQKVVPLTPIRTVQSTTVQLDQAVKIPVQIPEGAIPNQGDIQIKLKSSLIGSLKPVQDYINAYPWSCLEQKLTQVVGGDRSWDHFIKELPQYTTSDGLLKYFPSSQLKGSDILTSYLISTSHQAGLKIPEHLLHQMIEGLTKFVLGQLKLDSYKNFSDLSYRKISALEALSRYNKVTPEMFNLIVPSPQFWPTSVVIDWHWTLKRLMAWKEKSSEFPKNLESLKKDADHVIESRLTLQGSRYAFTTAQDDFLSWLMVSPETNLNKLITSWLEEENKSEKMHKMILSSLDFQKAGHWLTTTANTWGTLAFKKFAQVYETHSVTGSTSFGYEEKPEKESQTISWPVQDNSFSLSWPSLSSHLGIKHSGEGKLWVTLQARAAIPLKESKFQGYRIHKTIKPVQVKNASSYSVGDIVQVIIELESQMDQSWIVLEEPIPAGSTLLGSGLGNDSSLISGLIAEDERKVFKAFEERSFTSYRIYYAFVSQGKWKASYTLRLNQAGEMNLPPTHIEAMYAPEISGDQPNSSWKINP